MHHAERPIIAVVTSVASKSAQKELLSSIIQTAQRLSYNTAVFSNIYNTSQHNQQLMCEQRIFELLLSDQISAVILDSEAFLNVTAERGIAELLKQKEIPIVLVGARLPEFSDPRFFCLNTDDVADLDALTSHLIEAHGYTSIDFLNGLAGSSISEKRLAGYRNALRRHGIPFNAARCFYGDFWIVSGEKLALRYVSGELPLPQAIVCANDCMAFGILKTFLRHEIRVPQDVAVVGYELSEQRLLYLPLLTAYRRNRQALGEQAVLLIDSVLHGHKPPDFSAPAGTLICGESCPCPINTAVYHAQFERANDARNYEYNALLSVMEQQLTVARNLEEFVEIIGEHQWLVRYVQNIYLCLFTDWYEQEPSASPEISCRSVIPWQDTTPFEAHKFDFGAIFNREKQAAAYYFTPIFFNTSLMGHIVLKYDHPDSYDEAYRTFVKLISNSLEFLRMKSDIHYLMSCQDLSSARDLLTGMYNKKGMRKVFSSVASEEKKTLHFLMLRICVNDFSAFASKSDQRTQAILCAAEVVTQFCAKEDVCGYMGNHTFVCLTQSTASTALLIDKMTTLLIHHRAYLGVYGMDSFYCTGAVCKENSFDALYTACIARSEAYRRSIGEQKINRQYPNMLALRNEIYLNPDVVFQEGIHAVYQENINSMRVMYKRCFGVSFHQDCIHARIAQAKYYLFATSLSILEIAKKCGYVDHKYFQRQFTVLSGLTATQYRNLLQ